MPLEFSVATKIKLASASGEVCVLCDIAICSVVGEIMDHLMKPKRRIWGSGAADGNVGCSEK